MVHAAKRNSARCPTHPGALLREDVIPATGRTKAEIGQLLGISRQHLYDILRERKSVSPAIAVRLGKLFGDGAGIWVRMQAAYDTWNAERDEPLPLGHDWLARADDSHNRIVVRPQLMNELFPLGWGPVVSDVERGRLRFKALRRSSVARHQVDRRIVPPGADDWNQRFEQIARSALD